MFCGNCGFNIEDNAVFCPNCGAQTNSSNNEVQNSQPNIAEATNPVVSQPTLANPFEQTPVQNGVEAPMQNQENTNAEMPFGNQPLDQNMGGIPMYGQGDMNNWGNNMAPNFNVEEMPKKKFPKKLLFIGLPVVLVVIAVICNLSAITGFFVKSFGSDSDYLRYVEVNGLKSYCDSVSTVYDAYVLENADMKIGETANISVEVSDEGVTMLEELAGDEMDFEWLKNIDLNLETSIDGNQSIKGNLKISDKDIVSIDMVNDLENQIIYLAIPELSEQYLGIELTTDDVSMMMDAMKEFEKTLPSEKELNKLLKKYVKVAFDTISDAEMSKDTLDAGDFSKKCTTVEIEIDQRLVLEMANNILEEAKNDEELQNIVANFVTLMAETDPTYEDVDVDSIFSDAMEEAQDDIIEQLDELDGDGEVAATLVDYIDGSHKIIGREIVVEGETVAKYAMITKGGKFGFEFNVADAFSVTGSGKKSSSTITGDFAVVVEEQEALKFSLDKFNTKKLEKGELDGKVTIAMGDDVAAIAEEELYSSEAALISTLVDYNIEIVFNTNSKGGTTTFALLDGEEKLVNITSDVEIKNPSKISVPDASKVVEVTEDDPEAAMDYVDSMDITKIINNLESAGVPEEIVDAVETAFDNMGSMMSGESYASSSMYDEMYEDIYDYSDIDI